MTAPQPVPSGQARQQTAAGAGRQAEAIVAAAELAILTALAAAVLAVISGTLIPRFAARRLRVAAWQAIAVAEPQLRRALNNATSATRADVRRVLLADLGAAARFAPASHFLHIPRLHTAIRDALLAAMADADSKFWLITGTVMPKPAAERGGEAQALLDDVAGHGLTGYTDSLARHWNVGVYARTATAGAVARLHTALQLRAYESAGLDLVIVYRSSLTRPCPRCLPYVGRVLSISGQATGLATVADDRGRVHTAVVAGTVAEARARGLLHINCKDSLRPYSNGASLPGQIPWGPGNHGTGEYHPGLAKVARDIAATRRAHAVGISRIAKARAARRLRRLRAGT